jgi:hypothetical protein
MPLSLVSLPLGASGERPGGRVDQMDHDRMRCAAGADRRDGVVPAYAHVGGVAWAAGVGVGTDPLSVDGMIVAASTTSLADSRSGGRGAVLPWALLVAGSVASLTADVAVAEPTMTGPSDRGEAILRADRGL